MTNETNSQTPAPTKPPKQKDKTYTIFKWVFPFTAVALVSTCMASLPPAPHHGTSTSPTANAAPSVNLGNITIQAYEMQRNKTTVAVYNRTPMLIEQFSFTAELVAYYGSRDLVHGTARLIEPGGSRYVEIYSTASDRKNTLRIMSVDTCKIGGKYYRDCASLLNTPTPDEDGRRIGAMTVTYEETRR